MSFKQGELVEVSDNGHIWHKANYLIRIGGLFNGLHAIKFVDRIYRYKYCRKVKTTDEVIILNDQNISRETAMQIVKDLNRQMGLI